VNNHATRGNAEFAMAGLTSAYTARAARQEYLAAGPAGQQSACCRVMPKYAGIRAFCGMLFEPNSRVVVTGCPGGARWT
jgi:hypothetical protein